MRSLALVQQDALARRSTPATGWIPNRHSAH
jgi:hypothetical protein